MTDAWVGLGSNLGRREALLRAALQALAALGEVTLVSPLYETEPVGFRQQGPFLNAVACVRTALPPAGFLQGLQQIERAAGRVRIQRNGPRTLDLDLLFWNGSILQLDGLEVPHPRLHLRRFVLAPLCDVAPGLVHPRLGRTALQLLETLDDPAAVAPFHPRSAWP
jgi:2-amino-4-hydroxy-6-hydroxymethyldihydropteridine diphosphokinase